MVPTNTHLKPSPKRKRSSPQLYASPSPKAPRLNPISEPEILDPPVGAGSSSSPRSTITKGLKELNLEPQSGADIHQVDSEKSGVEFQSECPNASLTAALPPILGPTITSTDPPSIAMAEPSLSTSTSKTIIPHRTDTQLADLSATKSISPIPNLPPPSTSTFAPQLKPKPSPASNPQSPSSSISATTQAPAPPAAPPDPPSLESSDSDPTQFYWQDHEITGHNPSPEDGDEDLTGLNGVGFKPTPAMAHARLAKRKAQIAEYRSREAREERERRIERRRLRTAAPSRKASGKAWAGAQRIEAGPGPGHAESEPGEAGLNEGRRVRFVVG